MLPGDPSAPCSPPQPPPPYQPVVYRPKVVWNKATKKFVLWVNWLWGRKTDIVGGFDTSVYAVATSPTPTSRFKLVAHNVSTAFPVVGDFAIAVDNDHPIPEAFLLYSACITCYAPPKTPTGQWKALCDAHTSQTGVGGITEDLP